jgi:hypothetical protein
MNVDDERKRDRSDWQSLDGPHISVMARHSDACEKYSFEMTPTPPDRSVLKRPIKAATIVALMTILVLSAIAYLLIGKAALWFEHASPNVGAALLTALAAIGGVLLNQRANKRKDVAEAHRSAKVDVYRRFMNS